MERAAHPPQANSRTNSGPPTVLFTDGRRPEAVTRVQIAEFDGPLGLLLALIEARQLDILSVPLGALAEAYLDALAGLDSDRLGNIASFVAIASQLILIKSRAILPRQPQLGPSAIPDEGPDPEVELRARLILYRAYRDAGRRLQEDADLRSGLFRRDPSAAAAAAVSGAIAPAGPPLDPRRLATAIEALVHLVAEAAPPPEVLPRTITIGERARLIRSALSGSGTIVLQELLLGVRDRIVVTVTFLAMLELMKRREIVVEQAEPWGPIVGRATTPEERGGAPVRLDEPVDETLDSFA